jgi:hypothetical protein
MDSDTRAFVCVCVCVYMYIRMGRKMIVSKNPTCTLSKVGTS